MKSTKIISPTKKKKGTLFLQAFVQYSPGFRTVLVGIGRYDACAMAKNSSGVSTGMPSERALSSLLPAFSPQTR